MTTTTTTLTGAPIPAPAAQPTQNQPDVLAFLKQVVPIADSFFPLWEPQVVAFVTKQWGAVAGQAVDLGLKGVRTTVQSQAGISA